MKMFIKNAMRRTILLVFLSELVMNLKIIQKSNALLQQQQQQQQNQFPCHTEEEYSRLSRHLVCDLSLVDQLVQTNYSRIKVDSFSDLFHVPVNTSSLFIRGHVDRENLLRQGHCDSQFSILRNPTSGVGGGGGNSNSADGESINKLNGKIGTSGTGPCILMVDLTDIRNAQQPRFFSIPVLIDDVNDNTPEFISGRSFTVNIKENEPAGLLIALPTAIDLDQGVNGSVSYNLQGDEAQLFELIVEELTDRSNPTMSSTQLHMKTLQSFDRETLSDFRLLLLASDFGLPQSRTSTLSLMIIIDEVNDFSPTFSRPLYEVDMFENASVGQEIARVQASDGDRDSTVQIRLATATTFAMNSPNRLMETFRVLSDGGIILQRSVDYEQASEREFVLPLEVVDSGQPPRTSTATLRIFVKDVNDVAPQIEVRSLSSLSSPGLSTRSLHVMENQPINTFVARISVWDADTGNGGIVSCLLIHGREEFSLDEQDSNSISLSSIEQRRRAIVYHLRTRIRFDREERDTYLLRIQCRDKGQPQNLETSMDLSVTIDDDNDNGPKFILTTGQEDVSGLLLSRLRENSPRGSEVLQLRARDPDMGINGIPWFAIAPDYAALFHVDKISGRVTSEVSFDREVNSSIYFEAIAMDSQRNELNETIRCRVIIEDTNDNAPKFLLSESNQDNSAPMDSYHFQIKESSRSGAQVGRVHAIDADIGSNSQITYRLDPVYQERDQWLIHDRSGVITVAPGIRLDRERQSSYLVPIIAQDAGHPALSTSIHVRIELTDENDFSPNFRRPPGPHFTANVSISRDAVVGTVLYQVEAIDNDAAENARVHYRLFESIHDNLFVIDNESGVIRLNQSLHPTTIPLWTQIKLTIIAEDNGKPALSSRAYLIVWLDPLMNDGRGGVGGGGGNGNGNGGFDPSNQQPIRQSQTNDGKQDRGIYDSSISVWTSKILLILVVGIIGLLMILCVALALYFSLGFKNSSRRNRGGDLMHIPPPGNARFNGQQRVNEKRGLLFCGLFCRRPSGSAVEENSEKPCRSQYSPVDVNSTVALSGGGGGGILFHDISRDQRQEILFRQASQNSGRGYDAMTYQTLHSTDPNRNLHQASSCRPINGGGLENTYETHPDNQITNNPTDAMRLFHTQNMNLSGETLRSMASEELKLIFNESQSAGGMNYTTAATAAAAGNNPISLTRHIMPITTTAASAVINNIDSNNHNGLIKEKMYCTTPISSINTQQQGMTLNSEYVVTSGGGGGDDKWPIIAPIRPIQPQSQNTVIVDHGGGGNRSWTRSTGGAGGGGGGGYVPGVPTYSSSFV